MCKRPAVSRMTTVHCFSLAFRARRGQCPRASYPPKKQSRGCRAAGRACGADRWRRDGNVHGNEIRPHFLLAQEIVTCPPMWSYRNP